MVKKTKIKAGLVKKGKNKGSNLISEFVNIKDKRIKFLFLLVAFFFAVFFFTSIVIQYLNQEQLQTKEIQKNYCSLKSRKADVCIMVYQPVCGWFNESIKCIKYPCAATYSNPCFACQDLKVDYWTDGECPK